MSDLGGRINIRLEERDLEKVRAAARAAGLTLSEYARLCILGRSVPSRVDYEAIRELRQVGLALRQIEAHVGAERAALVASLLEDVREAIRAVGKSA